ncbi:MAG: anti-sigma factor family protein [Planctomycetota bacterium]|jgi:anti-sigma factor RsiW
MKCEGIRERLTAYLDGELDETGAREMENHVGTCAGCSAELEGLRETVALLDGWELDPCRELPAPDETADRVLAARSAVARPDGFPIRLWIAAGVAGAVLGFVAGLAAMVKPGAEPERVEPDRPAVVDMDPLPFDISLIEVEAPGEGR